MLVMSELSGCPVKTTGTFILTNPQVPVFIFKNIDNTVRKQTVGVCGVVPVVFKLPTSFIEPYKTAFPASKPQISLLIFVNAINIIALAKLVFVCPAGGKMGYFTCFAIEPVKRPWI